ncbi:MAG: hypothetical protein Q7K48_00755 [Fusobacterium sp. JB021]|nr:hypothetical protein [Fusobacterium sp. JB020]MDP0492835.1 hypothetical protein [Fusobacterium sp. JB021]MDP0506892.1 hypothetical protein [Fusobacterium sp. JB019]
MKKVYLIICSLMIGALSYGSDAPVKNGKALGLITVEDFAKVGVPKEKVVKANEIIKKSKNRYEYLLLDKKSKELEINKCILEGVENNWDKIDKLIDEIGVIEAKILKDRIRAQYEAQECISQEQYLKARNIAIERVRQAKITENNKTQAK